MHTLEKETFRAAEGKVVLRDRFEADQRRGAVVGSRTADGVARLGVDVERVMSVDHGALRIEPLYRAGWGRAGVAYGPFQRQNGLALSVFMLNGHNTSQLEVFPGSMKGRLGRWAFGSLGSGESKLILFQRMGRWLRSEHPRRMVRRVRWWFRLKALSKDLKLEDENMAVGWFPAPVPASGAVPEGDAFIMHALGPENGELWARVGAGNAPLPAVHGVENLPIYYVVVLRERGAAYYAASLPDAHGLPAHPHLRPLAIDPHSADADVYAGVQQCILGQIGFRVDTRVYGVSVAEMADWTAWYGTAHAADKLSGDGALAGSAAETGGAWRAISGGFERTAQGALGQDAENVALLTPEAPSGLIHALIDLDAAGPESGGRSAAGLVWRAASERDYWLLTVGGERGCSLSIVENGAAHMLAESALPAQARGGTLSLQILDDGAQIAAFANGALLFGQRIDDARLSGAAGVGLWAAGPGAPATFRQFEAHPRAVPIPPALDHGAPWFRQGERIAVTETFDGEARPLEGKTSTSGGATWQRSRGKGHIDILGSGAGRVRASLESPNPGRTVFSVDWAAPTFADLQLDMTPPGTGRGKGDRCRCGVVFWQDLDNYLIVSIYLEDVFPGASVSSFYMLRGFEELYDAVWTNTRRHIDWGVPLSLRVRCDGERFLASVNGESMLYRAISDVYPSVERLTIRRVGLVVNWEWGDDTGTTLHRFVARV